MELNLIERQLLQAYNDKADAELRLKSADERIRAIRNLIAGAEMAKRSAAEDLKKEPAPNV